MLKIHTLNSLDEVMEDLSFVMEDLDEIGRESEYVQQARLEQFSHQLYEINKAINDIAIKIEGDN